MHRTKMKENERKEENLWSEIKYDEAEKDERKCNTTE